VAGQASGKVKAMYDYKGRPLKEAGPSVPVEVLGFDIIPQAGEVTRVVEDEKRARVLATRRADRVKAELLARRRSFTLEDVFAKIKEGEVKDLNMIIKADVAGSVEALEDALKQIKHVEVKINIIRSGVGAARPLLCWAAACQPLAVKEAVVNSSLRVVRLVSGLVMALVVLTPVLAGAQTPGAQTPGAQAPADHQQIISANPFGLMFEWFNVEYQRRMTPSTILAMPLGNSSPMIRPTAQGSTARALAMSMAMPLTRLKNPNAVPRRSAGAVSATIVAISPCVNPMCRPHSATPNNTTPQWLPEASTRSAANTPALNANKHTAAKPKVPAFMNGLLSLFVSFIA